MEEGKVEVTLILKAEIRGVEYQPGDTPKVGKNAYDNLVRLGACNPVPGAFEAVETVEPETTETPGFDVTDSGGLFNGLFKSGRKST